MVIVRITRHTRSAAAARSSTEGRKHAAVTAATTRRTTCAVVGEWCGGRGSGRAVAFTSTTAAIKAAAAGSLLIDGRGVATDMYVEYQDGHSETEP